MTTFLGCTLVMKSCFLFDSFSTGSKYVFKDQFKNILWRDLETEESDILITNRTLVSGTRESGDKTKMAVLGEELEHSWHLEVILAATA